MAVYIVAALRSPIGVEGGAYATFPPECLGAYVCNAILQHSGRPQVDAVIGGNAVGTGGNIIRLLTLYSDLPETTPAWTIDMQCASAAKAVVDGYAQIASGLANVIIAGGVESASLQPTRKYAPQDKRCGEFKVAQFSPNENDPLAMLKGAERVVRHLKVERGKLDEHALRSHQNALQAQRDGHLRPYITPLPQLCEDECLRPRMRKKLLARMPLLLGEGTHITAGNACLIHDGAAFLLLASSEAIKKYNWQPLAKIHAVAVSASDPLMSPLGVLPVSQKVLANASLQMEDMTVIEWNEAFAVIDEIFVRHWPHLAARYNPLGGALAYGHPYGASGAIILTHLLASLKLQQGKYGLAAIAGAGGTGAALILENCHV